MPYDFSKNIELDLLKAERFDEDIAPNQKRYYTELAQWLKDHTFDTLEEAEAAMQRTDLYEGAGIARIMDDIELRIKAMDEVGYTDVADIHRMRREKFAERGNSYTFSQEWLDDMDEAAKAAAVYQKRKEAFGKVFSAYAGLAGNFDADHRKRYVKNLREGLSDLEGLGVTFDELAAEKVYRDLTMTTDRGMAAFTDFVHSFMRDESSAEEDMREVREEQKRIGQWARAHRQEIIDAGKNEVWDQAACIAVPSDAPGGYDFIALKEVKY